MVFVREMELRYTACAVFVLLFCAKKTLVSLLFSMAGTTGLEPATSAVTVSLKPVTYRNAGQWVAPFGANRHTEEPLLWPCCALDFGSFSKKSPPKRSETSAVLRHYSHFSALSSA